MADALSETELGAIVAQQIEAGKTQHHIKGGRATSQEKALDYFFGRMNNYVPPEPNRSKVVSRDVADTVGWLMPEIMRIFTASGRMFVAEPDDPNDLQFAETATAGLNHVFWKDNKGYEVVYSASWDSLVHGDAIVKTFYDETPVYGPAKYHEGLTEDEMTLVAGDERTDVLAKSTRDGPPDETGQPTKRYDIKARTKKADGKVTIVVIPPEEFLCSDDADCLEELGFKAHWSRKTRSALVEMGYDRDEVARIPVAARNETAAQQARVGFSDGIAADSSMELVDYFECFILIDADGDGVAELLRVCQGGGDGGVLLDWEVWEDEDPFDNIPCEPIPHRWESRSITDEEVDIQDVKTVLQRQLLNNTYWVNNPQRFVKGTIKNPGELDSPTFGGHVFGGPDASIESLTVEYIGDKALAGINYMDQVSARRTGVNEQSMALDPEVLQNQSATANQNATEASRSQPELIARNMAEWGWAKVGAKLLRLMVKHQPDQRTILVKGKPVNVQPGQWNPDMGVTINVGLGTGSRSRDAAMLGTVLQQQIQYTDRIGAVFPAKALDMLPYIHNTLTRFAEATGLRNPELYWPPIDPDEIAQGKEILQQKAQQPDPKMALEQQKAQSQMAMDGQTQQSNMQIASIKAQAETQKSYYELQTKALQLQNEQQQTTLKDQLAAMQLKIDALTTASNTRAQLTQAAWGHLVTLENARIVASKDTDPRPGPVETELKRLVGIPITPMPASMPPPTPPAQPQGGTA